MGNKKSEAKQNPVEKNTVRKIVRQILKNQIVLWSGSILLGLIFLVFGTILWFNLTNSDRVFPGTYIGEVNFSGKSKSEVQKLVSSKIETNKSKKYNLKYNDKNWAIASDDLELKYNNAKTVDLIWSIGRSGSLQKIMLDQWHALFGGNHLQASVAFNEEKLNKLITDMATQIDVPEKNATLVFQENTFVPQKEENGLKLNVIENHKAILALFGSFSQNESNRLIVDVVYPNIKLAQTKNVQVKADEILGKNILVKGKKQDYTLEGKTIAGWLKFEPKVTKAILGESTESKPEKKTIFADTWDIEMKIDDTKLSEYLDGIGKEIFQEAKDAKFNISNGKAVAFQVSQTGYELDKEKAVKDLTSAILSGKSNVELTVKVTEPAVTASSAEEMGIRELVAEGKTNFAGSPVNRRHNIAIGAKAIHGVIVKPDEEFSTIARLQPIDDTNGYLPELVIKENKTVPEFGGGLCQVSTTLFRAALNAGLKITQRSNHAYRVPYYEPPVGMDATIYDPNPDFRFVNNYKYPILIQSSVNGDEITFQIYGTKDARKVEISDPVTYDWVAAGDPIYTESPTLAQGEIKKIDSAHSGIKADFYYKVTLGDEILQKTTFHSEYTNWPAKYLYGPGTQIPPVE